MADKQCSSKMKWREIKITIWIRKESKEEVKRGVRGVLYNK